VETLVVATLSLEPLDTGGAHKVAEYKEPAGCQPARAAAPTVALTTLRAARVVPEDSLRYRRAA